MAGRGVVAWWGLVTIPAGIAAATSIGAALGAACVAINVGVINTPLLPIAAFALGAVAVFTTRVSMLRHPILSLLVGLGMGLAAVYAARLGAHVASGASGTTSEFLAARRVAGVPLLPGTLTVGGIWLLITWILGAIVLTLAPIIGAGVQSSRPFCGECRTWASITRATITVRSPVEHLIPRLRAERSLDAVVAQTPSGGRGKLVVKLDACRCGRIASIAVDHYTTGSKGEPETIGVVADIPVSRSGLATLRRWAASIDPGAGPRLEAVARAWAALAPHTFAMSPAPPESGEHRSHHRFDKHLGASDAYCDNDYTRALRRHLQQTGDFDAVEAAIAAQTHPEDASFVAEACADWDLRPGWLDDWAEVRPESAARRLVEGIYLVKMAWKARGNAWVPKDYPKFQALLHLAETHLLAAAEADPDSATPWAWLIEAAKGLQYERQLIFDRLREAHQRARWHRAAHAMAFEALTPKWGGSTDVVQKYARRVCDAAPPGSNVHVLIPLLHFELASQHFQREKTVDGYWTNPDVGRELAAADQRCFAPGRTPTMDTPSTRAHFAFALWKAGQRERAAAHLRVVGRATPWGPFAPGVFFWKDTLQRARRQCGT